MADQTIDEEDLDLSQDELDQEAEPQPVTQPIQQTAPRMIAPPGATAIAPPAYKSPFLSNQEAADQEQMRRVQYGVQDLPLAQAEAAITSAMKFQAIRGYQRDLGNGMAAHEALAKWGPMMFKTASGAGATARAATMQPPRPVVVGGRAYAAPTFQQPTAPLTPLTPEVVKPAGRFDANDPDVLQYKSLLLDIRRKQKEMDEGIKTPESQSADFSQLQIMQSAADQLDRKIRSRSGVAAPRGAAPTAIRPPAAAASGGRVRVRSKDGKIGSVPASQLDAALAAGYTRVQ